MLRCENLALRPGGIDRPRGLWLAILDSPRALGIGRQSRQSCEDSWRFSRAPSGRTYDRCYTSFLAGLMGRLHDYDQRQQLAAGDVEPCGFGSRSILPFWKSMTTTPR